MKTAHPVEHEPASEASPPVAVGSTRSSSRALVALQTPAGACVLVAAFSGLLRVLLLASSPFDGLYGQDAYFYLQASRALERIWTDPRALGNWLTSWGTPPQSVWPLGYHLQMALASLVAGTGPASGQVVSLLSGILTPVFTCLLFFAVSNMRAEQSREPAGMPSPVWLGGFLSGLIVACSALAVRSSVVVMADMTGLMWATLGVLLVARYSSLEGNAIRTGLLGGLCTGIAAITRYIYPLLVIPALWQIAVRPGSSGGRGVAFRDFPRRALPVIAPVVLMVGLQLLHNAIHPTPGLPSPVISNWSPIHAFQAQFDSPDGHLAYNTPMFFFFLVRPLYTPGALGPLFGLLALIGGGWLLATRAYRVFPLTLGWWLIFALFYSGNVYQADRFVLSYLPPLAVLAGFGFVFFLEILPRFVNSRLPAPGRGGVLIIPASIIALLGLAFLAVASRGDYRALVSQKNDYLAAAGCAQSAGTRYPRLPVLSFAVTFTLEQYTNLSPHDLYYESPDSVSHLLGNSTKDGRGILELPLSGFEAQWGNTPMGATYRYLTQNYRLEPLSCPGTSYTLYLVR